MEENEIKNCIVKIKTNNGHGTGFFIGTNKILTCFHVIKDTAEGDIKVLFKDDKYSVEVLDKKEEFEIDLAVLKVEADNKDFLKIDKTISDGDKLKSYGFANTEDYFDNAPKDFERGIVPITLEYEGDDDHFMKFKNGQVEEGHSGSPIINLITKSVCGVLRTSRNTDTNLGGYGIPIDKLKLLRKVVILESVRVKPKTILFNNYTAKNEPYYIIRQEDKQFVDCLEINNIWIFGASGQGKTALINRNLIQEEIEYIFCDLSPINITSPNDILDRIIGVIKRKFKIKVLDIEENRIITVVELLSEVKAQEIVIVIDEMAIEDTDLLISVAESFVNLVTYYTNCVGEESLKFVISTRAKPQDIIMNRAKASDYFEYICCDTWSEYLEKLFDSLSNALSLNITKENRKFILTSSESSPRTIKKILSKVFHSDYITDESIKHNVKLSLQESI